MCTKDDVSESLAGALIALQKASLELESLQALLRKRFLALSSGGKRPTILGQASDWRELRSQLSDAHLGLSMGRRVVEEMKSFRSQSLKKE